MLCASLMLAAVPAWAKDKGPVFVEYAAVKDKPTVALNRTKAYIMIRADDAVATYLMKLPTPADQSAYDQLRADALRKAHDKYVKKQASYDAAVKANANIAKGSARPPLPDKPVEPTEANFEFTPLNVLAAVPIGPINRFAKTGASTYLEEVTPGDYRLYGPIFVGPQNALVGSCFCMGSVAFSARAGEIVDLGFIRGKDGTKPKAAPGDSSAPIPVANATYFATVPIGTVPDARLTALPIVPARFRAAGKLPNYFGLTITRIPAMPGVIGYDRDRIVDLAAQ